MRYEYWSPWAVPRNTTLSFNDKTGQPAFVLQNPERLHRRSASRPRPFTPGAKGGVPIGTKNLRRGWASLALTPSTVIRTGAGIYFDGNINMNQFNDSVRRRALQLVYEVVNDTSQRFRTPGK